jgi:hypothetical protein
VGNELTHAIDAQWHRSARDTGAHLRRSRTYTGTAVKLFAAALIAGALIRLAALPLEGMSDVPIFKGWSYTAATRGVPRVYEWAAAPGDRTRRRLDGFNAQGDYPPLVPAELAIAGHLYRWVSDGAYPDTPVLNAVVKAVPLLADVGIAVLLFFTVRHAFGVSRARRVTLGYWVNPAMILTTSVLGYMDTAFLLPALGALVAGNAGSAAVAGGLLALAGLTKPQAIFIVPAVALALWNLSPAGRARRVGTAVAALALTAVAVLAVTLGSVSAVVNMIRAVGAAAIVSDMLSGNSCNAWWVIGHVARAVATVPNGGFWPALTLRADIVLVPSVGVVGFSVVRVVAILLAASVALWGVWMARRARDLWLLAGLTAFVVHAYVVLAVPVYDNHLFAAVPLLMLAAGGRRGFLPLAVTLSVIFVLNLNLFYGFSDEVGYRIPRTLTIVDATVLVALANCLALLWHATVLKRECSRDGSVPATVAAATRVTAPRPLQT